MYYRVSFFIILVFMFFSCAKRIDRAAKTSLNDITPPVLLNRIEPIYPDQAKFVGMEGSVELSLSVSDLGAVKRVEVTESSGYDELDDAARQYGKMLKFTPATRDNKSINVWLLWVVNFNILSENAKFKIDGYLTRINSLIEILKDASIEDREKYLKDILSTHERYFNYIRNNPHKNLNSQLKPILSNKIIDQWQKYWNQWPLTFVVLQDFDMRFPETSLKSYAIDLQIKQLVEDMERISETEGKLKGEFYKTVYKYLKSDYPKTLENSRKSDLQRYLNY